MARDLRWAAAILVFMLYCFYWHSRRIADTRRTSYELKAALRDPSVVFLSTQQSGVNTHFCPTTCVCWKHSNGVERYSSACSFYDGNVVMQPPPSLYDCYRTHTITFDGLCECVCVPAPSRVRHPGEENGWFRILRHSARQFWPVPS